MLFWTRGRLAKDAMNGGAGDAVGLRQLAEALPLSSVPQYPRAIEIEWLAANMAAFELGATHAGTHPLDDQVSFEFRNGANNHYDRPTQRAPGVDLLAKADKLDIDPI